MPTVLICVHSHGQHRPQGTRRGSLKLAFHVCVLEVGIRKRELDFPVASPTWFFRFACGAELRTVNITLKVQGAAALVLCRVRFRLSLASCCLDCGSAKYKQIRQHPKSNTKATYRARFKLGYVRKTPPHQARINCVT